MQMQLNYSKLGAINCPRHILLPQKPFGGINTCAPFSRLLTFRSALSGPQIHHGRGYTGADAADADPRIANAHGVKSR